MGFEITTLVVIGTDYKDSYKSNYHTITTTMAFWKYELVDGYRITWWTVFFSYVLVKKKLHTINHIAKKKKDCKTQAAKALFGDLVPLNWEANSHLFTSGFPGSSSVDIIQIFHVIVVNIQEYFPEVPWIAWMCYIAWCQRRRVI